MILVVLLMMKTTITHLHLGHLGERENKCCSCKKKNPCFGQGRKKERKQVCALCMHQKNFTKKLSKFISDSRQIYATEANTHRYTYV